MTTHSSPTTAPSSHSAPQTAGMPPRRSLVVRRTVFLVRTVLTVVWDVALWFYGVFFSVLWVQNIPGASTIEPGTPSQDTAGVVMWVIVAALWTTVYARRRRPLITLSAGGVIAVLGADPVLLLLGLHQACLRWSRPHVITTVAVSGVLVVQNAVRVVVQPIEDTAAGFVYGARAGSGVEPVLDVTVALAPLVLWATAIGTAFALRARRERSRAVDELRAAEDRTVGLRRELVGQEERARLAAEVHDALSNRLSVISIQSGVLETTARDSSPELAEAARVVRAQARASLDDLRGLLGQLRSAGGKDAPHARASTPSSSIRGIGPLVSAIRQTGTTVQSLVFVDDSARMGASLGNSVHRIVQESLTNAVKHAPGAPIDLYVDGGPDTGIRIRVSNPLSQAGAREEADYGSGTGLAGIAERASILGGSVWTGAHEGRFLVDVSLPWR
ncbi:sensor histidine kinase [Brevibacterium samyangense]